MIAAPLFRFSPLVAVAIWAATIGCTQPLTLDNRSCPCISGYDCCPNANVCVPKGDICPALMATASQRLVRQGGHVTITVTGYNLVNAATFKVDDYPVTVRPGATPTRIELEVDVPHGATFGQKNLTYQNTSEEPITAGFEVTAITAGPDGDDKNQGTSDQPFKTFTQAGSVSGKGDTIQLLDGQYSISTGEPTEMLLPSGVTVRGQSQEMTILMNSLIVSGDATIDALQVGARVHVRGSKSTVVFNNFKTQEFSGVTIDASATSASVQFKGATQLDSIDPSLWLQANGVDITIDDGAAIMNTGTEEREAILFDGLSNSLTVTKGTIGSTGTNALVDNGGGTFTIQNATLYGVLKFENPNSTVSVSNSGFWMSAAEGRSGIDFKGHTLRIEGSQFHVMGAMGIDQDNPISEAVMRNTIVTGYRDVGFSLTAGHLDLGTPDEPGGNVFTEGDSAIGTNPIALSMGGGAVATSSATSFDGEVPVACGVPGPNTHAPWYEIADMASLTFY